MIVTLRASTRSFVLALGLLTLSTAQAEMCADIFLRTPHPRITVTDLVHARLKRTREQQDEIARLQTPEEKTLYAMEQLTKAGVRAEKLVIKFLKGRNQHVVRIEPEGDAYLNRLARKMIQNFGTNLFFNPTVNTTLGATANYDARIIFISETNAYQALADDMLFHEIRHIAMSDKEAENQTPLINGLAGKFDRAWFPQKRWPWGSGELAGYESFLHFQELATWHQDTRYTVLGYKRLLEKPIIPKAELIDYLTAVDSVARRASPIFRLLQRAIQHEITYVKSDRFSAKYAEAHDMVEFEVGRKLMLVTVATVGHQIPWDVFESHLPEALLTGKTEELAAYFKTSAGKATMKEMALDYLSRLQVETEAKLFDMKNYRRLGLVLRSDVADYRKRQPLSTPGEFDQFARWFLQTRVAPIRFLSP